MGFEELKPTPVYDTYWKFAAKRQEVFFNRLGGGDYPWTDDSIIRKYKFTNAYRASDRVSQYLIRNVIYEDNLLSPNNSAFLSSLRLNPVYIIFSPIVQSMHI